MVFVSKPFSLDVDFVEIYWDEAVVVHDDDYDVNFDEGFI